MIITPEERITRAKMILELLKKEKASEAEIKSVERYLLNLITLHSEGKLATIKVNSMCNHIGS